MTMSMGPGAERGHETEETEKGKKERQKQKYGESYL